MVRQVSLLLLLTIYMLTSVAIGCEAHLASDEQSKQERKKEEKAVLTFDKEVVRKMLLEDGYKENDIEIEINSLSKTDIRLQTVLDNYLSDRTISPDFNVEGLTMKIIMEKFRCNFWNALDFMESYIDDPEGAKLLKEAFPFPYHGVRRR